MKFWRDRQNRDIEARLRDERPQPSDHLLEAVEDQIESRPQRRIGYFGRLAFVAVLTVALVVSMAGFGGLSYAASSVSSSTDRAVTLAKASVGLQKASKGKDDDKKKKKKNKKKKKKCDDDRDKSSNRQYCDDDDDDDDDDD